MAIASSVLESGGDVVCIDLASEPTGEAWCKSTNCLQLLFPDNAIPRPFLIHVFAAIVSPPTFPQPLTQLRLQNILPMLTFLSTASLQSHASSHSTQLFYHLADVTSPTSVASAFASIIPLLRYPLRGLVTCAGISGNVPAIDYDVSDFKRIMDVNVTGTFICAQAAAREFRRSGENGSVVLIASMSGWGANQVGDLFESK